MEWLIEVLRIAGWRAAGLAVGCFLLLWLVDSGLSPVIVEPLVLQFLFVGGVLSACLAVAGLIMAVPAATEPLRARTRLWLARRAAKEEFRQYLPFLSAKDRQILGYLLHHNQKSFTAAIDGGYAAVLIARGFIVPSGQVGQAFLADDRPFGVPDYVWEVLEENRADFPYKPEPGDAHPWRVPWML